MTTRARSRSTKTTLDRLRRSRPLASMTLLTTLLSIVGPLLPRTALAQNSAPPTNPGNAGASLSPSNNGIQQGQTDLGVPETGPAASSQANWSVDPSTGAFSASVPFALPTARGAVQPSLALVYASSAGQGVGGTGWSLNVPSIERHNPSGLPQYRDPARGAPITAFEDDAGTSPPAEDWFTFAGKALVPICLVGASGASCAPIAPKSYPETMPTWATGWHYYRLEVDTGSNLRFFWSPNHQTWVIQEPSGATMELGVPQDNPTDTGGTDTDAQATVQEETGDGGTGLPAVFRWNLVRQYDAQRLPGNVATNVIQYSWSRLPVGSPIGGGGTGRLSPIADLTDIYDTYPVTTYRPAATADFAHHTHLIYDTSFGGVGANTTRVDRARHANYITGVDVTSQTFLGSLVTGHREQVRRYVLSYLTEGHQVQLHNVRVDGWCSSKAPAEDPTTHLLPPEPASGPPACGVGPTGKTWPPATTFGYSSATLAPTFTTLPLTFNARPPQPPGMIDLNSDGLPDLLDPGLPSQVAYVNTAHATRPNTWTPVSMTLTHPASPNMSADFMTASNPSYLSAGVANRAQVNGIYFDPTWNGPFPGLTLKTSAGVTASLYAPVATSSSAFDWGTSSTLGITSVFPGCLQNCSNFPLAGNGTTSIPVCTEGSEYLGCDRPFGGIDINGDGLQDLLVSGVYGTCNPNGKTEGTPGAVQCEGDAYKIVPSPSYLTALNVKFSRRSRAGVVSPFAGPPPQQVHSAPNFSGGGPLPGGAPGSRWLLNDQPNVCVGGVDVGANPLLASGSTLGDVNGDGLPDIIALSTDHFSVWYGHGDGVFGVCPDGTTECSCAQAGPAVFSTATQSQWNVAWSPVHENGGQQIDAYASAQFHDVDGDGFDDAIVPSRDGFDVYFVVTNTGSPSMIHVDVTPAAPAGFGWPYANEFATAGTGAFGGGGVDGGLASEQGDLDSSYMFADMDGSGVDDVVIESPGGQIGYVSLLGASRPGLLTTIQTENGVSASIVYDTLPGISRTLVQAGTPWATQSPQSVHVVTGVAVSDLTPGIAQSAPVDTKYNYRDPVYDARDRQFVGFSSVEVENVGDANEPSMFTKTTFYQGYCNDSSSAYPCPTTVDYANHALRGLPVLTETYGDRTLTSDGLPSGANLATVHRTFSEKTTYRGLDGRYVHLADVQATDTILYDNSNGPVVAGSKASLNDVVTADAVPVALQPKVLFPVAAKGTHTLVRNVDKDCWGMSRIQTDLGAVDASGNSTDGAIVDEIDASVVPQDSVDFWIWRTTQATRHGAPDRTRSFTYDARGNLLTVTSPSYSTPAQDMAGLRSVGTPGTESQTGFTITLAKYTPDPATGNVMRTEQPGTKRCRDVAYDPVYATLPTALTTYVSGCGKGGLSTTVTGYAFGLGLATDSTTPDGQETKREYDPYGRLRALHRPDPSIPNFTEFLPAVTVEYADTTAPRQVHTTVTDNAATTLETRTLLDGYGRAILHVSPGDTSAGDAQPFLLSGRVVRNARGNVSASYPTVSSADWSSPADLIPSGPARGFTYDAFGRVTSATDLDQTPVLARGYADAGYWEQDADHVAPGTVSAGTKTAVGFDGHGRRTSVATRGSAGLLQTTVSYLPTGEPSSILRTGTDAAGTAYSYLRTMLYDSLGRLAINSEPASPWSYAYDDAGDLVSTADARGCGKNILYDGAGRSVAEDYIACTADQPGWTAPNLATGEGAEVFRKYDPALGRLTDTYDRGEHTRYEYDARGRPTLVQKNLAQPGLTTGPTPLAGYASETFAQQFAYDDLDRVIGQTTGEDENASYLQGTTVSIGTGTSASAVLLHYSQRGLLESVDGSYGSLIQRATYDADGLPHSTIWGDVAGTQTTYGYDARRRLHERRTSRPAPALWGTPVSPYSPPPLSPTTTTQFLLEDDIYTLDPVGNPTTINDARNSTEWPASAQPVTRVISYDSLYRVTGVGYNYAGAGYASPSALATPTESPLPLQTATTRFASETSVYDPFGNRTSSTDDQNLLFDRSLGAITLGVTASATPSSTNQIVSAGKGQLTTKYDAAGNLVRLYVSRPGPCASPLGCMQLFDYTWDEVGRLSRARRYDFTGGVTCPIIDVSSPKPTPIGTDSARTPNASPGILRCFPNPVPTTYPYPSLPPRAPGADVQFTYDAGGSRVLRASTVTNGATPTTTYTADIFPSLRLNDTTFGVSNPGNYDRSTETDQVSLVAGGMVLGRVVNEPDDPVTSNNALFREHVFLELADSLGSTSTVIDQQTSEVVERTTYTAFGQVESDYRPDRWHGFREPFKFTGKEDDVALGITYFGARYYSPYLGTWLSPDPLTIHGLGADLNPYAYVHGRTLRATDPFGLDCAEQGCKDASWSFSPFVFPLVFQNAGDAVNALGRFLTGIHFGGGSNILSPPLNPGNSMQSMAMHLAFSQKTLDLQIGMVPSPFSQPWGTQFDNPLGQPGKVLIIGVAGQVVPGMLSSAASVVTDGEEVAAAGIDVTTAAAEGFSATEMTVVNEVRNIPLDQLRAAFDAGGAELNIGGRTILVDPGVPSSGFTLFGENGFVLGREAFASEEELTKTLLHELYRLVSGQAGSGATQAEITAFTEDAATFADRAHGAFF